MGLLVHLWLRLLSGTLPSALHIGLFYSGGSIAALVSFGLMGPSGIALMWGMIGSIRGLCD